MQNNSVIHPDTFPLYNIPDDLLPKGSIMKRRLLQLSSCGFIMVALVMLCVTFVLSACSSPGDDIDSKKIVGYWESSDTSIEMMGIIKYQLLFEQDGKARVRVLSSNGRVRLEANGEYAVGHGTLAFSGDITNYLSSEPYGVTMPSPDALILSNDGKIELYRTK